MVVSSRPAAVAGGATERGAGRARPGGAARAQAGRPRGLPSRREQIRGQPCVHRQAAFGRCRLSSACALPRQAAAEREIAEQAACSAPASGTRGASARQAPLAGPPCGAAASPPPTAGRGCLRVAVPGATSQPAGRRSGAAVPSAQEPAVPGLQPLVRASERRGEGRTPGFLSC